MARRLLLPALFLAASAGLWSQPEPRLLPVDEAAAQPEFFVFRAELIRAVARRDAAAILEVVHPDIKVSFGGDHGVGDFREYWELEAPDSRFWTEFSAVLALGGRFMGPDRFVAPYTFADWPNDVDSFEHLAVVGSGVRARAAPRADAPGLATLDFTIVRIGRDGYAGDGAPWQGILLPDGRQAYVPSSQVRSPIDYRAFFERAEGKWQLTLFLSGD